MRHWTRAKRTRLALFVLATCGVAAAVHARADSAARNDLPQMYRTTRDWGQLPPGMKWAAVTAVEPSPDGRIIYVVHRCFDNACTGRFEEVGKLPPSFALLNPFDSRHQCSFPILVVQRRRELTEEEPDVGDDADRLR